MIISIVGSPDSGKTTLIEKMAGYFLERGLKICVVKHHSHGDFEFDKEGKDSWNFYQKGADVAISAKNEFAIIGKINQEKYNLDYFCDKYLSDYDLILTEGFNIYGKDRVVVLNENDDLERFKKGRVLAVVCEREIKPYRTFRISEAERVAELIFNTYFNTHKD
ncbi:molybdopterin guanine dinucleotide biosynthesis accessory protein MobB [Archaeoglobus sulfaticallidus PM70-1]|uniref:Molybdopterin guanine dinucleotide biosynthesis accessory protein MobB n=1 Tax=Archaeoglobus sulfaticallidus PM70-1 TaxID=387631 RepID=N0BI20_9EURY|nr:molybdopterin-guanine dinucleotide biosynthesis protein B [Archaeoglobus sulfaticallidus]AGK61942.1 molybdopterin guanine dinucleotide biosynthesis accessory protein MobB [Archaeoglobus sulfaticallidus PM70-1]